MLSSRSRTFVLVALVAVLGVSVAAPVAAGDADLIERVELRLDKKGFEGITVTATAGVVRLDGAVETLRLKEKAGKTAGSVAGVAAVENALRIAFDGRLAEEIAADIALALRDPHFNTIFDWVEASVMGRRVVLSGWVTMPWKIEAAQRRMSRVPGVEAVEAKIEVLPVSTYDDQIRLAAARRVYGSHRFADYATWLVPPIHFVVRNGELILLGEVRNRAEKMLVRSMVTTAGLPLSVVNRLDDGSGVS